MNYYEHHLGDYVRDTAHLSILEDGTYRRLLDAYYIRERPLPVEQRECFKLCRATSKAEREAVAYVLAQFFELHEDGYHQARADAEVARFQDKQRKARASADARWAQPRPASGGNANASANASPGPMRTHSEGNAPHTRARAHTGTAARPSPVPSPQSPDKEKENHTRNSAARGQVNGHNGHDPTRAGMVCRTMKAVGIADPNPGHPDLLALIEAGASDSEFEGAAATAAKKGKGFVYAMGVLLRQRTEAAQKANGLHRGPLADAKPWDHDGGTIRKKGIELGVGDWDRDAWEHQQPGAETFQAYHRRVAKAVKQREEHHA